MRSTVAETSPPSWPRQSYRDFWRYVCSPTSRHPDSLFWYMKKVFGMDAFMRDNPTKQWFTRSIHKPYCKWKQTRYYRMFDAYQEGRAERIKMITVLPRGFLKTTVNIGTQTWAQLENPEFAMRLGAADDDLARDMFRPITKIYEGGDSYSAFNLYYGNWYDSKRIWQIQKGQLVHALRRNTAKKEPSFAIFSVLAGFTAHHPEIATMDDPVTREKLRDEGSVWLEKANTSVIASRPAMPECSIYELIGTRYHDDDPIGHYTHQEGVKTWDGHPCQDPEVRIGPDGEWEVFFLQVRDPDTNESIAPEINTTNDLDKYEASNSIEFWNQMMNQPARGDHMGLDVSQIKEMYVTPEQLPSGDYVLMFDTAFKDPKQAATGDESVFLIFKRDMRPTHADYYFIEGYGSRKDRIEDFATQVVLKLQQYQHQRKRIALMVDERSPGKIGAWFHYLENRCHAVGVIMPPHIELPRGGGKKGKKVRRIRIAAGFWADGRVKIVQGAPGSHKLVSQMTRFEVVRHDDWADAAADLFHPDVYRVQVPLTQSLGSQLGQRQVGPDDDILLGRSVNIDGFPDTDVIDTIWDAGKEWN